MILHLYIDTQTCSRISFNHSKKQIKIMGFTISSFIICLLILALASATKARLVTECPFDYLHHFGDGVFDSGNAVRRPGGSQSPATRAPYGMTLGAPNGRWTDGLLEVDYGGIYFMNVYF